MSYNKSEINMVTSSSSSSDESDASIKSEEFIRRWRELRDSSSKVASSTIQSNTSIVGQQSTSKEIKCDEGLAAINVKSGVHMNVLIQKPHDDPTKVGEETTKIQKQQHTKPVAGLTLHSGISNAKGGESLKRKQTLDNSKTGLTLHSGISNAKGGESLKRKQTLDNSKTVEMLHSEICDIKNTLQHFIDETNFKFEGLADAIQESKKKKTTTDKNATRRVTLTLLNEKIDQILENI